jgi:putative two-component system response regulator
LNQNDIIVVDDNANNLNLLEELLQQQGHAVRLFQRGRPALAAARNNPPDLILLDINMPEMDGYQVCEQLKSSCELSGIPVIFLTALDAPEDRLRGFQCGGVDYISKPFRIEEVQVRVGAHLKLRRLQQKVEGDNCRLKELVQTQVKKIADSQLATIFAIAKLVEARDLETGRHLERIQSFCWLLASRLGKHPKYESMLNKNWISNIFHASPLHDIGKVAIADQILLKPGPLTPDEYAVMKTHAAVGAQTLRSVHSRYPDSEFIEMGIQVAGSHHERWDGTGYPEGLAGEEIPLCARILSVADCYDAIRSNRSYKAARSHEDASVVIRRESGRQFDPVVAAVYVEVADTFRRVWTEMASESPERQPDKTFNSNRFERPFSNPL